MTIDGKTTCYAVLGHPVAHSLSPAMHNASLRALGLNAVYIAFDVEERDVATALRGMRDLGFGGVNVTIPLKYAALQAMDELAPCAGRLGVVNTVAFRGCAMKGYNTDGVGILADLAERFGFSPRGRKVFVLGCGGAGRAAALTMADEGAASIWLANRGEAAARAVAEDLINTGYAGEASVLPSRKDAWEETARRADLVLHCSSVGLHPGEAPLMEARAFRSGQYVYDLVYSEPRTAILREAERAGAEVANGLGMLLHQGAASFRIWTGRDADIGAMREALAERGFKSA